MGGAGGIIVMESGGLGEVFERDGRPTLHNMIVLPLAQYDSAVLWNWV